MSPERMAAFAGWATLAIGASLVIAPRRTTGPLGLVPAPALHRV